MVPIRLRGLEKSFGTTRVLAGIDLEIDAGELFFLLGGSGCGKTTLLRLIAGFAAPDVGSIRFGESDVTALPAERRGIGMVFQHYALWPHLTVGENVAFGLEVRGTARGEKAQRVEDALKLVELSGFAGRRIGELSGGQQQRVALARALVVRPQVLLLDEPLSNLDARLRGSMRQEIRRVCKTAGVTAIYVTHDQAEALSTADRIAVMAGGRIAQVGTPRELYERPRDRGVAEFLGDANLVPATWSGERAASALGELALPAPAGGATGLLCVRPERLQLLPAAAGSVNATITGAAYLGAAARWTLALPDGAGGSLELIALEHAPPPRSTGDRVGLKVDPAHVTVLGA